MITKVNRPPLLSLVPKSKAMENDPGSSQGSGMAYSGSQNEPSDAQKKSEEPAPEDGSSPALSVVTPLEQMGMTEVVKDLFEHKTELPPANPGLTTHRYLNDSSVAKGLLLNRKAE